MKHEQAFYVRMALKQAIDEQATLLKSPHRERCYPIIQEMNRLAGDLSLWLSGSASVNDPVAHFLSRAQDIERMADQLSEELWHPLIVNLSSVFEHMQECAEKAKTEGDFARRLKEHLDFVRLRLLEQMHGVRLLENANCRGEDMEKVFFDFLKANLPSDVRVFRGGHIYDYEGHRSAQVDIIVTTPDALGFCPSETESGKYNALIDHVVAAISIKSTIHPRAFEEVWQSIQSIPSHPDLTKDHPAIKDHAWPLCYVLVGETPSLETLGEQWAELATKGMRHPIQVLVALNEGYAYPGNVCWPMRGFNQRDPESHRIHRDLEAGLGLGWVLTGITGRVSFLNTRSLASVDRMAKLLDRSECRSAVAPTYDKKHATCFLGHQPINGKLAWGCRCCWLHNNLLVHSADFEERELQNPLFPARHPFPPSQKYEPRWFNRNKHEIQGNLCKMEEWLPDHALEKINVRREVVFDCTTGTELSPEAFVVADERSAGAGASP